MEISDIGWFSYEKTIAKFRDYDVEKKKVIVDVYKKLIGARDAPQVKIDSKEHK